ncbi:MAG: hypothetical protein HOE90_03915 [Bacteriovoracaceae bacterium]|jgi:hypothetical protein|nr:hypothetical protein [Bacteriovoracaceae bacterium]
MKFLNKIKFRILKCNCVLLCSVLYSVFCTQQSTAEVVYSYKDYAVASEEIAKWLNRSMGHFDFLSATPLSLPRAGVKFFLSGDRPTQFASDYGYSFSRSKLSNKAKNAYTVFGKSAEKIPKSITIQRAHLNYGLGHFNDVTLSFSKVFETDIFGIGLGWKHMWWHSGSYFISSNSKYSYVTSLKQFQMHQFTQDISFSTYLFFIDLYGGARHVSGSTKFKATSVNLKLPTVKYVSSLKEVGLFYGAVGRLTTNSRVSVEANHLPEEIIYSFKFSFKFNTLFPDLSKGLFRDARYEK